MFMISIQVSKNKFLYNLIMSVHTTTIGAIVGIANLGGVNSHFVIIK